MIDKSEIEQRSTEFDIHTSNVQRDYVFGRLLAGIYGESPLAKQLVLKGGNGFRKAYFARTRFSNDLDFSVTTAIDPDELIRQLNSICEKVHTDCGISFDTGRNKIEQDFIIDSERKVFKASIYFRDFYGNPERCILKVVLDVTEFDKIYLPIQDRFLIHPYSDADQVRVILKATKLEEMIATKLKCLLQRRETQDLYDFVFAFVFSDLLDINRSEIVTTFLKKTIFEPSPGMARQLLLELPLDVLERVWDKYIICPLEGIIPFKDAMTQYRTVVNSLFGSYPVGYGTMAYFPSAMRNPIIQAGQEQQLLSITYNGIRRVVEPYSLMFKRKQNGQAREYLYVWDRVGGSSGPGIKCFVHTGIQDLEILNEKFDPRYEIELSKAGELGNKTYFSKPFARGQSRFGYVRSRRRQSLEMVYRVQCPVCGKVFRRSRPDTRLNQHKDQYGNRCYGRQGMLIY